MRRGAFDGWRERFDAGARPWTPADVVRTQVERHARRQQQWLLPWGIGLLLVGAAQWAVQRATDPSADRRFVCLLGTQAVLVVAGVWATRGPRRSAATIVRVATATLVGMVLSAAWWARALPGPVGGVPLSLVGYLLAGWPMLGMALGPQAVVAATCVSADVAVLSRGGLPPPAVAANAGALALVSAALLVGLAATRRRQLREYYRRQLNRGAFALASRSFGDADDLVSAVRPILELAAAALDVTRVELWRLDELRSVMRSVDGYDRVTGAHPTGGEIALRDHSGYVTALEQDPLVQRWDGRPAAACPHVGTRVACVLEATVRVRGRTGGVLCFQHETVRRSWTGDEGRFASYMAHLVALAIEASERNAAEDALRRAVAQLKRQSAELSETVKVLNEHIAERRNDERQLRESRAQLRALSTRLIQIQEDERRRMAREIHDELGQTLTALRIDLDWLARRLDAPPAAVTEKLARMGALVDATVDSVQAIARNLRPPLLDDVGLPAALEWLAREFEARTGIRCRLRLRCDDFALDADRAIAVFRLVQEALTNVARHARATRVSIGLEETGGQLVIRVRDDGRGIRREEARDGRALGLVGMRERVHLWGGRLRIQGRPGRGTLVRAELPLAERSDRQSGETG